jgi:hypothetical protein
MILTFRHSMHLEGAGGVFVDERICIEHPRLVHLHQRLIDPEHGELRESSEFRVQMEAIGHSATFPDVLSALDYLRANPFSDDIVAVPPWEPPNEQREQ